MTRTLPWLNSVTASTRPETVHSAKRQKLNDLDSNSVSQSAAIRTPPSRIRVTSELAKHQSRSEKSRALSDGVAHPGESERPTPSNSSPRAPPESDFMIEGLDNDDIYVMVEDEFYDVAKSFTAHLHQAEYIRQRQLIQERNAQKGSIIPDALHSLDEMNGRVKDVSLGSNTPTKEQIRHEVVAKTSKPTGDAVRFGLCDSGVEVKEVRTENSLLRMMGSPGENKPALINHHGSVPKTRASAGFGQARTPTRSNKTWKGPRTADPMAAQALADDGDASETASENDLDAPLTDALLLPRQSSQTTKNRRSSGGFAARVVRQQIPPELAQPRRQTRLPDLSNLTKMRSRLTPTKKSTKTVDEVPTFLV